MKPLVIAHRGACWDAPENTVEAFELAVEQGADYVEFDVRAREGELVICHDPDPPAGLATLDDALAVLAGRVGLCVEIKEDAATAATIDALLAHDVAGEELMIVSFLATALDEVKQRLPGVRTVFHLGPAPEPARGTPYWGVGIQEPAEGSVIRGAQELGLATLVFTVNEPDRMQELAALGVDGIFSDRPALLAKTLAAAPRG